MKKSALNNDSVGAIMRRMGGIEAKLSHIARTWRNGAPFHEREAKSVPLRKELAELHQRLWGNQNSA